MLIAALICFALALLALSAIGQDKKPPEGKSSIYITQKPMTAEDFALPTMRIVPDNHPPLSFRLAQSAYVAGEGVDWGLSYAAVTKMGYTELNGAAAWQLKNPTVGVAAVLVIDTAFILLTDLAWKQNRVIGWALVIAAVLVKGYVIAHNLGTLESR
jgi:hypothetical protein